MREIYNLNERLTASARLYFMNNANYVFHFGEMTGQIIFIEEMFKDIREQIKEICRK